MRIERGCFERASYRRFAAARVRVVVEPADFERLELREFERADRLSPCIVWCHEHVGAGFLRWEMEANEEADIFYFTEPADAAAFHARFTGSLASAAAEQLLAA